MRISDWSSDVCSSDLGAAARRAECDVLHCLRRARYCATHPPLCQTVSAGDRDIGSQQPSSRSRQRELRCGDPHRPSFGFRSEEHTSELQSLMRISYAVFCLKKKIIYQEYNTLITNYTD